jgi:hypothetical protein
MNTPSQQSSIPLDQANDTAGEFHIVCVYRNESFVFMVGKRSHFPAKIQTEDQAYWEAQNTTIGIKPLFYSNRDPRRTTIDELYLDSTASGESLTPTIERLRFLMEETDEGNPSLLLVLWGDRQETAVLTKLTIIETFFARNGNPLRAQVSLELLQVKEKERTRTVRQETTFNPIGNF